LTMIPPPYEGGGLEGGWNISKTNPTSPQSPPL
jgi:hypothetical protein